MNTVHPNIYANSIYGSLKSPSNEVFVELQCSHFIPETQTTCFCGLEYKEHTTEAISEYSTNSSQTANWTSETCTSKRESRARGVLLTYRHGIINHSLYARLSYKSDPSRIKNYLKTCWKPNYQVQSWSGPSLIVNLCASSNPKWSTSVNKRILDILSSLLKINDVLIVVSGIHTGLTELLGRCLEQHWVKTGIRVRVLGVCQWGRVMENDDLTRLQHSGNKNPVSHYHIDSKPDVGKFWLHSNVTDFLLVDDGTCLESDDVLVSFIAGVLGQFKNEVQVAHVVFDDSDVSVKTVKKATELKQNSFVLELDGTISNSSLIQKQVMQDAPRTGTGNDDVSSLIHSVPCNQKSDFIVNSILNQALEPVADPFKKLQLAYKWNNPSVCEDICVKSNLDSNQENEVLFEASRCLINGNAQFCRIYVSFNLLDFDYFGSEEKLCKLYKEVYQSNDDLILSKMFSNFFNFDRFPFSFNNYLDLDDMNKLSLFLNKLSKKVNLDVKIHFEGVAEERRVKNPMRELFIFSLLTEKYELAEEMWIYLPNKITTSLFASALITQISNCFVKRKLNLQKNFEQMKNWSHHFERKASEMIEYCHKNDPDRTGACMKIKYEDWSNIDMAGFAQSCGSSREFLATEACTHFTQQRWYHYIHPHESVAKIGLCSVLPFLSVLLVLDVDDNPDERLVSRIRNGEYSVWMRMIRFYRCPVTIFTLNQLYNVFFVLLFGFSLLREQSFEDDMRVMEYVVVVFALIHMMEKLRYVVLFRITGSSNWSKIPLFVSVMAYLFLYIAFLIRLIPGSDQADAKILNVLSFCLFACKCLQMFVLSPILGKKLIILQRMLPDLVHYSLILMLFSLVYGVASLALVKHISGGNTNFQYVWIIIFRPVLQMFGDLYIEDLNMKVCNNIVFDKCLPDGFEAEIVVALILMVCYLLIVRVLMFTWLIAVFVNKYRQLEKEAHKLLLIQQYYLVHEYFERSAVPPPFVIVPFTLFWLKAIYDQRLPDGSDFTRGYQNNIAQIPELIHWESAQISDLLRRKKAKKDEELFNFSSSDVTMDGGLDRPVKSEEKHQTTSLKTENEVTKHVTSEIDSLKDTLAQQSRKLEAISDQILLTQQSVQSLKDRHLKRKSNRRRSEDVEDSVPVAKPLPDAKK